MAQRKKARMRPAKAKARSGGDDQISSLERSMEHLEKLVLDIEQRVRGHAPAPTKRTFVGGVGGLAPNEMPPWANKGEGGLSLKDAAPPTMATPTRRTVMERLALLETTDELLDAQHREFALEARAEIERLMERLAKLEAALGEV